MNITDKICIILTEPSSNVVDKNISITLTDIDFEVVEIDNLQKYLKVFATFRYGYEYNTVVLSNKLYSNEDDSILAGDSFAIDYAENGNVPDNIINDFRDSDSYNYVIDCAKQELADLNN